MFMENNFTIGEICLRRKVYYARHCLNYYYRCIETRLNFVVTKRPIVIMGLRWENVDSFDICDI